MPPKVPTLPWNQIEPRLSIAGLSVQDICALLRAGEWCAVESRNQQVMFLYDFTRSKYYISLQAASIGQVFEIHEVHVRKIRSKARKQPDQNRPFALSPEQEDAGFLSLPPHRTLHISFRSSMSSHLESSKRLRSINVGMTRCGEKWIMSFGYSVLMSRQRRPRRSGHLG
jgi:hypothetical protein